MAARGDFRTSSEAAALLGVSPSTIKRWVDSGELPSVKTEGGHRRIRRLDIETFRSRLAGAGTATGGPPSQLVDLLLTDSVAPQLIEARLLTLRAQAGDAPSLAAWVAEALRDLGERWASNRITILDEHLASERLARALGRLASWIPLAEDAPRALLATACSDEHTLGLSLCELVLREAGWASLWSGRATPATEIARRVAQPEAGVRMVLLSASVCSSDRRALAEAERVVGEACARAGIELIVGGDGNWPTRPRHAALVRDLGELDALARRRRKELP